MENKDLIEKLKDRAALLLIRAGYSLSEHPLDALVAPTTGRPPGDMRTVLSSELNIVISGHVVERMGLRSGREMGAALQRKEIENLWPNAVLSVEPPDWLRRNENQHPGTIYATIADFVFPLVPYPDRENTYVATTVLSKIGERAVQRSNGRRKKHRRSASKIKRRKHTSRRQQLEADEPFDWRSDDYS